MSKLIKWEIHEVTSKKISLIQVKFRGTLRKFAIEQQINVLVENASDKPNTVRFALIVEDNKENIQYNAIVVFLHEKYKGQVSVASKLDSKGIVNPVLSKLDINNVSRYE